VDRRSTLGRRGLEGVGGALVAAPVAGLSHIAVAGRRATLGARELLRILGAVRARPVAQLGQVAGPGRGPALRPGVARRVLASDVATVALIEGARVAVVSTRRTVRLLGVGRARGARAGAGLGQVALARRGATLRPRVARRMLAERAAPVTGVGGARVAVVRARRSARLLAIGRAG